VPYQTNPVRHEYRLSEAGIDFYPAIIGLLTWGDRWRGRPVKPLQLFDRRTGALLEPIIACRQCRLEVRAEDLMLPPPSMEQPKVAFAGVLRRSSVAASYTRGRPCSVAETLTVIGDRWSFRIIRQSFLGARRFEEFIDGLGIARNILTERLERLVEQGVLDRIEYQNRPPRHEYLLTRSGRDLIPPILMMMDWAQRWGGVAEAPRTLHKPCGAPLELVLLDRATGSEIKARSVSYSTSY
jgi:DNA-binding HxlR family transcriptional regulator